MDSDDDVLINELAQGLESMDVGISWFEHKSPSERLNVLRSLSTFVSQAHPVPDDVSQSIVHAGVKATHTSAVLLSKGDLHKIVNLPHGQQVESFRLLVVLLGLADGRRRQSDLVNGCTHWWHHLTSRR